MNPLSKRIGIIGGGQLGKMLMESVVQWNIQFAILDKENAPASKLADKHTIGGLKEADKIVELSQYSDVLTYEIEHINVEVLRELETKGKRIIPKASVLDTIRDKGSQKEFYVSNDIPTAPFVLSNEGEVLMELLEHFPGEKVVVKSRTGGYDGKGVEVMSKQDAQNLDEYQNYLFEHCIDFDKELSVIVAIGEDGEVKAYPVVEMEFHPTANLVEFLFAPAEVSLEIENKATKVAIKTAKAFKSPGLFAVEMFLTKKGDVLVNETAPRPHNSGHHTIEACACSQYEQLVRILLGLPLGDTSLRKPAAMINIIGSKDLEGSYYLKDIEQLMAMEGVHLHLYNKAKTKPFRKLGHVTVEANSISDVKEKANRVKYLIELASQNAS